jgi:hypothetical protein
MSVAVLAGVVAVLALAVNLAVHQVEQGTRAGALWSCIVRDLQCLHRSCGRLLSGSNQRIQFLCDVM